MKCNVGKTDKIIRWVIGLGILGAGAYFKSWLGLLGLIPIITAIIGWCGLYMLFNISTCKKQKGR
jgi:hypothetical protein